jgi:hypothetical protein
VKFSMRPSSASIIVSDMQAYAMRGGKPKVEAEVHRARHFHQPAFNDQHIVAFAGDAHRHIARARHIDHHRARLEVFGVDDGVHRAGDGDDDIRVGQVACEVVRDAHRAARERAQLLGDGFQARRVASQQQHRLRLRRERLGAGAPDGTCCADHRDCRILYGYAHLLCAQRRRLYRRGDRVAVACRDGDLQAAGDCDSAVADH